MNLRPSAPETNALKYICLNAKATHSVANLPNSDWTEPLISINRMYHKREKNKQNYLKRNIQMISKFYREVRFAVISQEQNLQWLLNCSDQENIIFVLE